MSVYELVPFGCWSALVLQHPVSATALVYNVLWAETWSFCPSCSRSVQERNLPMRFSCFTRTAENLNVVFVTLKHITEWIIRPSVSKYFSRNLCGPTCVLWTLQSSVHSLPVLNSHFTGHRVSHFSFKLTVETF